MKRAGSYILRSFKIFYSVRSLTLMSTNTSVCSPLSRFCFILPQKLSGFHFSVQRGTETTSPNRQTCSPQQPTALIMLALWITCTGMSNLTARKQRSECVVAQKASPTTKKAQLPSLSFDTRLRSSSIQTSQKSLSASMSLTPRQLARSLLEVFMTEVQYSRQTYLHDLIAFSAFTDMSSGSPSPNPMMQKTIVDYYKQQKIKLSSLYVFTRTNILFSLYQLISTVQSALCNRLVLQQNFTMHNESKKDEDCMDVIDDGFSSQEQLLPEEIVMTTPKKEELQASHKQQVHFKIPPPQEIKDRPYSLRPDLETGWQTHLTLPVPIPIIFESERFDHLIRRMLKHPKPKVKLCYLGPRYENTYYAWYDKTFTFPYDHVKPPNDMKFTNRPFCGQHWQAEDQLLFDSFFEGGNLDCVIRVGERQYDCFMRVDSNTAGHLQWFNFKVKGWKKLLKYKINICNFQKDKCLFSRGMKPYMYSEKRFKREKVGWQQDGEAVRFEKKPITAAKIYDLEMRQTYRLSFEHYTSYDDDQVQMAYCVPYTYSRLGLFLKQLTVKPESKNFLKITKLCHSLGGLELPLVIVHQGLDEQKTEVEEQFASIKKRCILISGRAHPGESNGSHMMEGFIEWLCSDSKNAQMLRRYIVFKIVPMLNPDGVALGNYRTGLSGRDFNREYKSPDKALFPQVYNFKKLVSENKVLFGDKLVMFLDFHGHSTKKNTFAYGPEFPIIDRFYYEARLFPKLISNSTCMFRYYSCNFKINELKETTARAVMLRRLNVPLSYTIETSNGCYFDPQLLKDVSYTQAKWREMGHKICHSLFQYVDLILMSDRNRLEKMKTKYKTKQKGSKKSQSPSKKMPLKSAPLTIFSNMQNEKIKNLLSQIKKAEQDKQHEKVSDDEMSEGSSDLQGEENDLSPTQTNFLLRVIKGGKCRSVSRCKMRKSRVDIQHHTAQQIPPIVDVIQATTEKEEPPKQVEVNSKEEIFASKAVHYRRPVQREHIANIETKRSAKIVNFSFCSQSPKGRRQSEDRTQISGFASKLNFLQLMTGKWTQEKARRASGVSAVSGSSTIKQKGGLDLTDLHLRKTFTHNFHSSDMQAQFVLTKRALFDNYKYRRLLIGEEEISLN